MDTATEILTTKYNKNLAVNLLELILTKKTLIFLELSIKYLDIKQSIIKTLTIKISTRLLGLELNQIIK